MTRTVLALGALFLISGLTACGSSNKAPSLAITDLESSYYEMVCHNFVGCEDETFISVVIQDEADCLEFVNDAYAEQHGGIADMVAAVNGGTVIYDAEAAFECLVQQRALSCEEFGKREPAICNSVFTGTIADDGACEINTECISNYCDSSQACPGTCVAALAEGQACQIDDECEKSVRCVNNECQAYTAALGSGVRCEADDNDWCGDGLYCHEQDETCAQRIASGETCDGNSDAECVYGSLCVADAQGDPRCVEVTVVETEGQACSVQDAILCALYTDLSCKIDDLATLSGTCVPVPRLGETCFEAGANMTLTQCDFFDKLYCDVPADHQTDGVCAKLKVDGQPCTGDDCLGFCNENSICESDSNSMCD